MNKAEYREIALSAARGEARRKHLAPEELTSGDALAILDDLSRVDRSLIASTWYAQASDHQVTLFRREWNAWKKSQREGTSLSGRRDMQDNEAILNRLIAEGESRNWREEPGTMITVAEALARMKTYDVAFYVKDGLGGHFGSVSTFHHKSDQDGDILRQQALYACVAWWNERHPWKISVKQIDRILVDLCEGHEEEEEHA